VEKAEKEAQEARQAVKTQQQAVDQAQNELNLVQDSQEEKQKNYDYAFAKVKALGGNTRRRQKRHLHRRRQRKLQQRMK